MKKVKNVFSLVCGVIVLTLSLSICTTFNLYEIKKKSVSPEITHIDVVDERNGKEELNVVDLSGSIYVDFIDVGQADSCAIITPHKDVIVIDAGEKKDASQIIDQLNKYEFEDIDLMILSHPNAEHIGGAETLLNTYSVSEVLMSSFPATSKLFSSLLDCLDNNDIRTTQATKGMTYSIDGVNIEVIAVDTNIKDNNNSSIVCKVSYGDIDMLFTGDAEIETEEVILDSGVNIDSEILKVGHHGSDTSTSEEFLDAISPELSIISVGEGNSYGHPSNEILNRLYSRNIEYYRTDESGTIELEIDGKNIFSKFNN